MARVLRPMSPLLLVASAVLVGQLVAVAQKPGDPATTAKPKCKVKHWVAPMDPSYISDKPGKSPMGMDLVPVCEGEAGAVVVSPVMVQDMGVRVAKVRRGTISHQVRTLGEVVVAEDLVSVINLRFSGWIEKLYVDQTGVRVRRDQPLFTIYSPELVSTEEEYLQAVRSSGRGGPIARSARTRLELWGISGPMIRRIEAKGRALRALTIRSPRAGYVLFKNVVAGAKARAGEDLFRVGKLGAIWVRTEVYEFDAPWVRVGEQATMELSFEQGRRYPGLISYIYPTLNPKSRTLSVRMEFPNPHLQLKPGMFATVRIRTREKHGVLLVPTEAILRSGERSIVFVAEHEVGRYEPRQVVTGIAGDDNVTEIVAGLSEGETVVVSGQFLIDSESQLQSALEKMTNRGLQVKPGGAPTKPGTKTMKPGMKMDMNHQHP